MKSRECVSAKFVPHDSDEAFNSWSSSSYGLHSASFLLRLFKNVDAKNKRVGTLWSWEKASSSIFVVRSYIWDQIQHFSFEISTSRQHFLHLIRLSLIRSSFLISLRSRENLRYFFFCQVDDMLWLGCSAVRSMPLLPLHLHTSRD